MVRGRCLAAASGQPDQETQLANPLFVRTGIVAGLGTVAVLMFFAAATGALPIRALLARVATQAQPAGKRGLRLFAENSPQPRNRMQSRAMPLPFVRPIPAIVGRS